MTRLGGHDVITTLASQAVRVKVCWIEASVCDQARRTTTKSPVLCGTRLAPIDTLRLCHRPVIGHTMSHRISVDF